MDIMALPLVEREASTSRLNINQVHRYRETQHKQKESEPTDIMTTKIMFTITTFYMLDILYYIESPLSMAGWFTMYQSVRICVTLISHYHTYETYIYNQS